MKFGVHLIQQNIEMAELRRLWTWADTAGFDWIDASDHFYEAPLVHENHGDYWEGTTIMTALACETKNLRIGSLVLGMNYRHPAVLANALAAMDHLSGGRIELGIGAGWYEDEYRAYGIPFPPLGKRLDILEEGIQVIRLLHTEDHVDFEGEHFTLTDACCNPKPLQERLRIWGGGVGRKRTLPMIARLCDGWNGPYLTPWQFRHLSRVLVKPATGRAATSTRSKRASTSASTSPPTRLPAPAPRSTPAPSSAAPSTPGASAA